MQPILPELVEIKETAVTGFSVQTCNADEVSSDTQAQNNRADDDCGDDGVGDGNSHAPKLGLLWARFYEDYLPSLPDNPRIFGVYYEYESDETGNYRVLAGSSDTAAHNKNIIKETVIIPTGLYLKFKASGAMPDAVMQAWSQVWAYFSDTACAYERSFLVDFEYYPNLSEVEVCIGIA